MEQGNWAEAGMLPLLEYAGWTLRDQQRELQWPKDVQREDAVLIGHIDGIIMHPAAPKDALWENKFLGGYGYKKIVESGLQWGNPAYYSQAQLYMYMLREDGEDIDFAVFHAAVKDSAAIFENRGKEPDEPGYVDPMYEEVVEYDEPHALKTLARRLLSTRDSRPGKSCGMNGSLATGIAVPGSARCMISASPSWSSGQRRRKVRNADGVHRANRKPRKEPPHPRCMGEA